jgi:hypothetical protein
VTIGPARQRGIALAQNLTDICSRLGIVNASPEFGVFVVDRIGGRHRVEHESDRTFGHPAVALRRDGSLDFRLSNHAEEHSSQREREEG